MAVRLRWLGHASYALPDRATSLHTTNQGSGGTPPLLVMPSNHVLHIPSQGGKILAKLSSGKRIRLDKRRDCMALDLIPLCMMTSTPLPPADLEITSSGQASPKVEEFRRYGHACGRTSQLRDALPQACFTPTPTPT